MDQQVCFAAPAAVGGILSSLVVIASAVSNSLPAPDQAHSPVLRVISRIVHYIALDIVTANKPTNGAEK